MPRHPLLLIPLAAAVLGAAPAAAQECGCPDTFEFVTTTIRQNYAGWSDKVTPATRPALDSLTERLRPRIAAAATDLECTQVMQEWIAFFRDGHVGVGYRGPAQSAASESDAQVRARFASAPAMALDEAAARRYLDENRARLDPIEGIWESVGSPYRLAIVLTPGADGDFAAVVLRADSVWWMPGQVKAVFTADGAGSYASRFRMRDHSEERFAVRLNRGLMMYSGGFVWAREYPAVEGGVTPAEYTASRNTEFRVRRLSPQTLLVQVPTMSHTYAPTLDSLLAAHRADIASTPNLIVDVRGNGGGSDLTYAPLLPLLYTDSIRSPGVSILATPLNIRNFQEILEDSTFPAARKPFIRRMVADLRAHAGGLVDRGANVTGFDSVLPYPRRVGVVMDGGCASSCEQFVLAARDSRKATLFGTPTAGVLDYANVSQVTTTCPRITVRWATSRSNRLPHDPVDPHGIAPSVPVPADEVFPVEWARRWLEAQGGEDR